MLGVISSRRDCCASRRVGSGRSSKCCSGTLGTKLELEYYGARWKRLTLVVCRTFDNLGKSFTPLSSILMDESSSCKDDRREETEDDKEAAMLRNS